MAAQWSRVLSGHGCLLSSLQVKLRDGRVLWHKPIKGEWSSQKKVPGTVFQKEESVAKIGRGEACLQILPSLDPGSPGPCHGPCVFQATWISVSWISTLQGLSARKQ
jgi:hypothetical protein